MASVATHEFDIPRQSVVGSEGLWTKMFDPPRLGPPTPEMLDLTALPQGVRANPVPGVMAAAGMLNGPGTPHTVHKSLMHNSHIATWDAGQPTRPVQLRFFLFGDDENNSPYNSPTYPGATMRVPRGAVFHAHVDCKGPPPHTIHWHGIEPTPMNDGVGHCSFEVEGMYMYQWQPNFIGTYFYHCHRNTMQHFEFGLFGLMPFMPPDAYFASIDPAASTLPNGPFVLNDVPIGAGRDRLFRTAANLAAFPQFPGFIGGHPTEGVNVPDPWTGTPFLKFPTHPHAFTVPYDAEALWVLDDRDSNWSQLADDPFHSMPVFGTIPGVNDDFFANGGHGKPNPEDFFVFNDFNADYWFITGVPVKAHKGGSAVLPQQAAIPAPLNSGIAGSQVSINAGIGQTILIRCLDAAYNNTRITFPLDVVIIEWDGRALGVPPFGLYNAPMLLKAGTPIAITTARRFSALCRSTRPVNDFAKVEFIDTRSFPVMDAAGGGGEVLVTALIPIQIN